MLLLTLNVSIQYRNRHTMTDYWHSGTLLCQWKPTIIFIERYIPNILLLFWKWLTDFPKILIRNLKKYYVIGFHSLSGLPLCRLFLYCKFYDQTSIKITNDTYNYFDRSCYSICSVVGILLIWTTSSPWCNAGRHPISLHYLSII